VGGDPRGLSRADRHRPAAGHAVHAPDLFEGRVFADVHDGVAYAQAVGEDVLAERAAEAAAALPAGIAYLGMSLGCALATGLLLDRPGALGAVYLYGAVTPAWWGRDWPEEMPSQAHVAVHDEWREPEAEEAYAALPGAELFRYEEGGHLFAEQGHPDYAAGSARLATERVLAFLNRLA